MTSERKTIKRALGKNQMSNSELFSFLKEANRYVAGNSVAMDDKKCFLTEKLDGFHCSFGINENEKFFIQSNNSDEVTSENKDKLNNIYLKDFHNVFNFLEGYSVFQETLKNIYNTYGPVKFSAEMFPTGSYSGDENGDVVFVGTKYNKKFFGESGAFFVYDTSKWNPTSRQWARESVERKPMELLLESDTSKFRMFDANKNMLVESGGMALDLSSFGTLLADDRLYEKCQSILSKGNGVQKDKLVKMLTEVRKSIQTQLDSIAESTNSVLGSVDKRYPPEGVIFNVTGINGDVFRVKGTTKQFNENKTNNFQVMSAVSALEKQLNSNILTDVLGIDSRDLSDKIESVVNSFRSSSVGTQRENEFVMKLLSKLGVSNADENSIRKGVKDTLDDISYKFNDIQKKSKASDPDTNRKNSEFIQYFSNLLSFFKKNLNSIAHSDKDYVAHVAKFLLAKKLASFTDKIKESMNEDGTVSSSASEPTRTIVWIGRAQPWHKGHHAMIVKGIEEAKNRNATEILIMLVRGEQTSKDIVSNPLNESEQINLIKSIYDTFDWSAAGVDASNVRVVVNDKPLKSAYVGEIVKDLYDNNRQMVGLLVGTDRVKSFAHQFADPAKLSTVVSGGSQQDYEYPPVDTSGNIIIEVPRNDQAVKMSGTEARNLSTMTNFETWLSKVAPSGIPDEARILYNRIFTTMSKRLIGNEEKEYKNKIKGIFWGNV